MSIDYALSRTSRDIDLFRAEAYPLAGKVYDRWFVLLDGYDSID